MNGAGNEPTIWQGIEYAVIFCAFVLVLNGAAVLAYPIVAVSGWRGLLGW